MDVHKCLAGKTIDALLLPPPPPPPPPSLLVNGPDIQPVLINVQCVMMSFMSFAMQAIPKWLFNGNEYPYYGVEYGEGTPCDLKEGTPRSVTMRYICDLHSHSTGTVGCYIGTLVTVWSSELIRLVKCSILSCKRPVHSLGP